ncbi:MAG: glycolate oxidase subunit GlcE [Methylomonas sp.]|jgi:glycolate oxidase FAD binding subunit|uniref:glycolate oxidase subunit GlcE n=1 Tax=Methylomonas sp. TaxID=418 RepID=UPI0025F8812E|nr:glycolate oxidase subunit GlcE [Methylomonas sp.]MCK9605271.1 glycolate oxidase subunit GlcE [Methylomonas sp.]
MHDLDIGTQLQQQVLQAVETGGALRIVGGDSKAFYGGHCAAEAWLNTADHCGVIDYQPSEQVITARAGSRIADIAELLAGHRQMLGFEPPDYTGQATLGGTLACGFSGPRRPFAGSARDFMLGCKIINGRGQILNFGGRVMKNVAGFDVSRLMVGALGTTGVLLEASLRVLPVPETDLTLACACTEQQALSRMQQLSGQPWPLSGSAYDGEYLRIRLSGAETALTAVAKQLAGDADPAGDRFWHDLREQRIGFFQLPGTLWRISVAPATAPLDLVGRGLLDWGGALRWLNTDMPAAAIHAAAAAHGGHAICYRGEDKSDWLRLDSDLLGLQQNIRLAFDPLSVFNPGRLFS